MATDAQREAGGGRGRRTPVGTIAAATFLVGVVVLFFLLRDDQGEPPSVPDRTFDTREFEARVNSALEPVTLRPLATLRIRVRALEWRDATGRAFLTAPSASFALDLSGGGIVVSDGVIERPVVRLVRTAGGRWNFDRALAPLLDGDGPEGGRGGGGVAITLMDITLRGGAVTVDLPDTRFAATDVDMRLASARLSGPGVDVPTLHLASANATLELPDTTGGTLTRAVALEDARLRILDGGLGFDIGTGTFGSSTFADATGVWSPGLGALGLDAELRAERFRLADLPWLRAEVPEDAVGSFRVRIEPVGAGRTAIALSGLTVTAPGSSATGSLRVLVGVGGIALEAIDLRVDPLALSLVEAFTGPLPYTGTLRGTLQGTGGAIGFDLVANLAAGEGGEPFETALAGTVAFTPEGLGLDRVTVTLDQVPLAALRALAPGLPLAGPVSGTVTLNGLPSREPVRIDIRLEAGGGIASLAGVVDLTGPVPAYDVDGRLTGIELRQVLAPAFPPAQLHGTFALEGSGTTLETAVAGVRLDGTFTGWRAEPGDTIALSATLAGGRLDVRAGRLELGPVSLVVEGDWALAGRGGGSLRYGLAIASLEPLAPYLPPDPTGRARFARGALEAQGTLSGTLAEPILEGSLDARDFRFGEWAAERLEGEYAASFQGPGFPRVEAQFTGTEIRTPSGGFETFAANVDFTRPAFSVAVEAVQLGGGILEVEATGRFEDAGAREVVLGAVEVDLDDQRWRLPSPARIAWTEGDVVRVEDLRLEQVDGGGLVRVSGIVAPVERADVELDVRALPVGDLLDLLAVDAEIAGNLSVDGAVRSTPDGAFVALDVALDSGDIRGVAVRSIDASIGYTDGALTVNGTGALGDSAFVELEGRIPARLSLGLPPSFEFVEGGEIEASLVTDDFPLATLDPGIRSVQDMEGLLRADVRIGGTVDAPRLTGDMALVDGGVTVPMLDKRYTEIAGLAELAGRELTVRRLVARSGGTASVTGVITFDQLSDPTFDLTAVLSEFVPQGVDNSDDAVASGTLRLTGALSDPVLSGHVTVDEGGLSLTPLTGDAEFGERLAGLAESFAPIAAGDLDLPDGREAPLRVDGLRIEAGSNLWFVMDEARAQLEGTLDLQTVGNDLTLRGTLAGQQGTFDLRVGVITRRFDIVEATIRFLGSPDPNPALDITASRRVPTLEGGLIDVRVRVTGNLNNPQVSLGSAGGVQVAESELLSLVLFGRPTYTAADAPVFGQQGFLREALLFTGAFDLVSAGVGNIDAFEDIDHFEIQMRPSADGSDAIGNLWLIVGEQFSLGSEDVLATVEYPIRGGGYYVLAAEWRIDSEWTVELSREPETYIGATGTGNIPVPMSELDIDQQWLLVVRRRWTY